MKYILYVDEENYDSCGIDVYSGDEIIRRVSNISASKPDVAELVRLCNELEVEVCHLDDIIEDYLTDFEV